MKAVVFRNRTAAVGWSLAAAFLLVVLAFTLVYLREGPPAGLPPPLGVGLLALFWLFALGGTGHLASRPCLTVTVEGDGLRLVQRTPFGRRERSLPLAGLVPAAVVETRDDDGDPYFIARAELPDGTRLDLREGHDRERCAVACADFNSALAGRV